MKLKAALLGDLAFFLKNEKKKAAKAVTKGISSATTGLKQGMQRQVTASGLGMRLAKSWRGEVYPKQKNSLKAAGVVYTKAEKIMQSFEFAHYIRSNKGLWIAIPTPNVPKQLLSKRITPQKFEKHMGIKLQFVYRKYGASLLVANIRASYSKRTRNHSSKAAHNFGKGASSAVMFWLVPAVKMPKLINFKHEAKVWHNKLPQLILKNWVD